MEVPESMEWTLGHRAPTHPVTWALTDQGQLKTVRRAGSCRKATSGRETSGDLDDHVT